MKVQNPLSALPSEISHDILLRLKPRHLFIAQCVSKQWYSFIESIKLSYTGQPRILILWRRTVEPGERTELRLTSPDLLSQRIYEFSGHAYFSSLWLRVLGSCNGFVLLGFAEHIVLWNPHTDWSTKVLELRNLRHPDQKVVGGLCYDPSTSDHKVVLLLCPITKDNSGQIVLVSSVKNKGWRKVPFPYNYLTSRAGVSFNNTLHWIVSDIKDCWRDEDEDVTFDGDDQMEWDHFAGCNKIVYFDPVDDTFKILPSPTRMNPEEEDSIVGTGIIDGCFSMARKDENRQLIQVSVMKEYGKQESWVTSFVISLSELGLCELFNLKLFSQNGKVLMKGDYFGSTYVYDIKEKRLERKKFLVRDGVEGEGIVGISFYVESLDLPHEVSWREGDQQNSSLPKALECFRKCARAFSCD